MVKMKSEIKQKPRITGELFYKFFQCPHWIWYDFYGNKDKKMEIPPLMKMIFEGGIKHKRKALESKKFYELDKDMLDDLDEAYLTTLDLMKQGKNIYRGVLLHEDWVGMPDLLEARPMGELNLGREASSKFGDYYYVVYDVKDNLYIRSEHKFQLVFYSMILEQIQGVRPKEAYIINANGEEKSFMIEDFVESFHMNLEKIDEILNGEKPPPFLKSGCKQSPWYSICTEDTEGCGDVSLIYRLSQADQRNLYEIGIKTVDQLASADVNELHKELPHWYFDKISRFHNQAQSLIDSKIIVLKKPEFPKVKKEIYFDIESDPTTGIDYLFGFLIKNIPDEDSGKKATIRYKSFLAKNKSEEEKTFREVLDFIDKQEDFVIYFYSAYELRVFERLARRYKIPWKSIRKFKDNSLDLLVYVTESVVLPLYFYGLKDVAKYIGFEWRDDEAGGAESVVWYNEWKEKGDQKILDRIIEYNKDDVKATMEVKDWLESQKPRKVKEKLPEN